MIFSLIIDENELTGSIPTEVGSLTKLTQLELGTQLFSVVLFCFETKQIRSMDLTSFLCFFKSQIVIADNALEGLIPTEIGLLTKLTELWLRK